MIGDRFLLNVVLMRPGVIHPYHVISGQSFDMHPTILHSSLMYTQWLSKPSFISGTVCFDSSKVTP